MKLPLTPPDYAALMRQIISDNPERFIELHSLGLSPDPKGNYYHWDKLRHLKPPNGLSSEEWWFAVKTARRALYRPLPFTDKHGQPFQYAQPDVVQRLLHQITRDASGVIQTSEVVTNPQTRDTYLVNSLIEEAITSSQLEGAATTRKVAKEMLRQKRKPVNTSERMIVNNYHAMQFIGEIKDEQLTPDIIYELHRILMEGTLENPAAVGQLRTSDDIYVGDERDASKLHIPPRASELNKRLANLCAFANSDDSQPFMHPVIKAILLHFALAYDHPFEDGNGRTARALFYWSMLHQGYWLMEFISISRILKAAPAKYTRSYLYTETDDNDVTYFIVHQLEVIIHAITDLFTYLKNKQEELGSIEQILRQSPILRNLLNYRQVALLNRAIRKPQSTFTVESHRGAHNVSYQTARTDLLNLEELGLLDKRKVGKAFVFVATENIQQKLKKLKV